MIATPPAPSPTPRFSIIINNYNYSAFLRRSIESALAQTLASVDVVVVDDASTDASPALISSFADRITPVLKTENAGHLAALKSGYERSRGDIVIFLDSDDYLYPDALARLAEAYAPDVAMYQRRLDLVNGVEEPIGVFPPPEMRLDEGDVTGKLVGSGRFSTTVTSGLAFSRRALDQLGAWPLEAFRQGGDGFLVAAAPFYGDVATVAGVAGAYRQHGTNHAQFASEVAKKARWRLEHDEARYAALRDQAARRGLHAPSELGLADATHLEERIASLRLDPARHAYRNDSGLSLLRRGLAAVARAPLPASRRAALMMWWALSVLAPRPVAGRIIRWRLSAGTRPAWVSTLSRLVRLATGGREPGDRAPAPAVIDSASA